MPAIINTDFKIYDQSRKLTITLDNMLENVPRKDKYYKDKLRDYSLDLIETVFYVNEVSEKNLVKEKYYLMKKQLSMIDFIIDRLYHSKYISEKQVKLCGGELSSINRMIDAWCKGKINNASSP